MAIKTLILDTNIVLDLLLFHDPRADWIRHGITQKQFGLIYTAEMLAELTEVIARPLFAKSASEQIDLLKAWTQMASHQPTPPRCPFRCDDPDDQVFIDLAYHYRPSLLLSKDRKILQLQRLLALHDVRVQTYPDLGDLNVNA